MNFHTLLVSLIICLTLTSCHVGRFFVWNFADTNDKKKFASVDLKAPESTFYFKKVDEEQNPLKLPETLRVDGETFSFENGLL